jgi:hypothetical protein
MSAINTYLKRDETWKSARKNNKIKKRGRPE